MFERCFGGDFNCPAEVYSPFLSLVPRSAEENRANIRLMTAAATGARGKKERREGRRRKGDKIGVIPFFCEGEEEFR